MARVSLSQSSEVFATGFLADAIGNTLYRYRRQGRLASGDRRILKGALAFLERVYKGYLLALPRDEAKALVEQVPPYKPEYTSAFNYAVKAWEALALPLDSKSMKDRIERYQAVLQAIQEDLECEKSLEEDALMEVQGFFSKISELTLRQMERME